MISEVSRLEPSVCQDSFLEARLFAFHNHLFKNQYDSSCWFIDKNGGIWKFETSGSLDLIHTSKTIGLPREKIYNSSIKFAAKEIVVVCDGNGNLEILIQENSLVKSYCIDCVEPAVLADTRYVEENSKLVIALHRIDEVTKDKKSKKISRLIFLHYNLKKNSENDSFVFEPTQKQTVKVKRVIENVYLAEKGNFCYIIGQDQVEFDYDSIKPVDSKNEQGYSSQIKIPQYCWSQDEDSITIYVKIPEKHSSIKPKVETTPNSLLVIFGDNIILNGKTSKRLDADLTTWKCKDGTLEIELAKSENGLMWNELISGDTGGEYLPNQALAAEIHERLKKI